MRVKHHEEQVQSILCYLEELSFHYIKKMEERLVNGWIIIPRDFDEVKTKLKEARTKMRELQKKRMGQRNKISVIHFRISDLEMTLEDIQDRHRLYDSIKKKTVNREAQLQALVDKKKVIIIETTIKRALMRKDEGGIDCLPNEAIFEQLAIREAYVPIESSDPPLSRVNTLGSGEDRLQLNELMDLCIKLSVKVLSLEQIKNNQAAKIEELKKRNVAEINDHEEIMFDMNAYLQGEEVVVDKDDVHVQKFIDKVVEDITAVGIEESVTIAAPTISTAPIVSIAAKVSTAPITSVELTLAQALVEIKIDAKPKAKIIVMQEPRKSFNATKRMFDQAYKRVNTFIVIKSEVVEKPKNAEAEVIEGSSKRSGDELEQKSSKKQKLEDDDPAVFKNNLQIVPDDRDDVTIDATPLSSKSATIVDNKNYREGRKVYIQIIRAYGHSTMYVTFRKMLKNFNRDDLEVLWNIVKNRFENV
nr:hypothetical protein [Tanacetum cinerariifolium]